MNGLKTMNWQASSCLLFMLCFSISLPAEERAKESLPSMDLLEFLGEWETEEGEWLDPVTLDDEELGELNETVNTEVNESENEN